MDKASDSPTGYDLSTIDQNELTPIVRRSLENRRATISDWRYDRLHGGAGDFGSVVSGVYRFSGSALDHESHLDWSIILKVVGTTAEQDDPTHSRYWKREIMAYQSEQLTKLPDGFTSPRFLGSRRFSEKIAGIWMEDVRDEVGSKWPIERYGVVARHLGRFNGAYLTDRELPSWSWLFRDWPRALVTDNATPGAERFRRTLEEPHVRAWFADGDAKRALILWEERQRYFDLLDRLPQTLLHRDAFRRNLFIRHDAEGSEEIVAVDWAYVGIGAIGEDIVPLVHGSLAFSEVAVGEARKLESICIEGYLNGLSDAGWHGNPRLVRLGYAAGSAICFGIGYVGLDPLPEDAFSWLEQAFGLPIDDLMVLSAQLRHFVLDLADEARSLMDIL